jgi:hypothetical protein
MSHGPFAVPCVGARLFLLYFARSSDFSMHLFSKWLPCTFYFAVADSDISDTLPVHPFLKTLCIVTIRMAVIL